MHAWCCILFQKALYHCLIEVTWLDFIFEKAHARLACTCLNLKHAAEASWVVCCVLSLAQRGELCQAV